MKAESFAWILLKKLGHEVAHFGAGIFAIVVVRI